jgi:LEA14-like dessication related protein
MKGLKTVSILAGLGLIGYAIYRYYLKQIDFLKDITYEVKGLKIKEFTKQKVSIDVTALIFNASNVEATVTQMYLDVYTNGVKVGNVNEIKDILIKPKQSTLIDFNFSFDPTIIAKNIVDLITISVSSKDIVINIKGYIRVKSGFLSTPLPFEYTTNLKSYLKK